MSARKVIDLLHKSTEIIRSIPTRNGNLLHLPGKGDMVVAGDLHNHAQNYKRIIRHADLANNPDRHLILQELIHGGALGSQGEDISFDMLGDALELLLKFPDRVHMILANHDLAQVQKVAVMKDGMNLTERFALNFRLRYAADADKVMAAFADLVHSLPLAAITVTGLLFTHSLPVAVNLPTFDFNILRRPLTEDDYQRTGSVYQLIWGRKQTADALQVISKKWWAEIFICGHQQQDAGMSIIPPNMLIIDSSHNHGVLLHANMAKSYTMEDLAKSCIPLASL